MTILIDNGHGIETCGKCSPDGRLREWKYNRRIAAALHEQLKAMGIKSVLLVPEDADIQLAERVRRANALAAAEPCVLISIHVNAAGCGGWHEASGWCAFVGRNASARSRQLAKALTAEARAMGLGGNRSLPPEGFWTAQLAMCERTVCPAVLTENLFMDNRGDLAALLCPGMPEKLAALHARAIAETIAI